MLTRSSPVKQSRTLLLQISVMFLLMISGIVVASDDLSTQARWRSAISNGNVAELQSLLDSSGADSALVGLRSETGKSALMIACKLGERTLVDALLARGADVKAMTKTGGTPFMFASLGGHVELVRYLAGMGVDVNAQGANGWSALMIAAAKGYAGLLSLLVDLDADINARDVYRWTPLMRAVDNRHDNAVQVLLEDSRVELDHQDEAGNTALHHAALHGDMTSVKRLVFAGADKALKNNSGFSAAQLAAASPNAESLEKIFSGK